MPALRIGFGTDLHRLEPGKPLKIGGVAIDSPVGTVAHSDGDVLLHALIDALLGAVALGDIGEWFPPSDARWKDADSADLLHATLATLRERVGPFSVENVDATVHLEAPKLKSYKPLIRGRVAALLGIAPERVSVKAKTAEGLAPIGTGEALEAQVAVLLTLG